MADRHAYPLMLDVTDRLVVVVGGGAVAARKVAGLLAAGARRVRVVAPRLHPDLEANGATVTVITVNGANDGDAPVISGITGNFADSLLGAEVEYSEATGEVNVTARFGMGHMATSAAASTCG